MLLLASTAARAEDIVAYQADGDAPAAGTDPKLAALDDAFARAVISAIADLVPGDIRVAHKAELDREIVTHARLWVVNYHVSKDETNGDRRQLSVSVRIDRDKVRAKLAELKIVAQDIAAPPPDSPPSHTVTILLRVATAAGARASYGAGADGNTAGVGALTTALRAAGMAVRRAPTGGPAARADGELPLADEEAIGLAGQAEAELAVVAGITVGPPVPVRGQPGNAALVTAHVALVDRDAKKLLGRGVGTSAIVGEDINYAIDRAVLAAASDVVPQGPQKLAQAGAFHGDDTPLGEAGTVLLRLSSKVPWSMVQLEERYLAGARGIRSASLRRVSPAGWVIGVQTTDSIEKIAQVVKKPPATDTYVGVKIVGAVIEVEMSGAP